MVTTAHETIPGLDTQEVRTTKIDVGVRHRFEDGATFVVLAGRAMIEFDDDDSLVFVRRGSLCRLQSNAATRWTISEPIEYLLVTEASVVFKEHDDEPARGGTDVNQAHPVRPFRPRRHVS
jgi:hypothetical protein